MTKGEAAIVSAYTGILIGEFSIMHEYIEKIMDRPVFTHEMGIIEIANEIKEKSRDDFIDMTVE